MSARAHPPTNDVGSAVFDPAGLQPPSGAAVAASRGSSEAVDCFEGDATEENPRQDLAAVEQPTPTEIDPSAPLPLVARPERCEPVQVISVISMMDHTEGQRPKPEPRVRLHVQLRTLAEVSGSHEVQRGLGYLAPPRDPARKRERQLGDHAVLACVAVLLAGAIALAIWFVAG